MSETKHLTPTPLQQERGLCSPSPPWRRGWGMRLIFAGLVRSGLMLRRIMVAAVDVMQIVDLIGNVDHCNAL
jgi:hypothetical protein